LSVSLASKQGDEPAVGEALFAVRTRTEELCRPLDAEDCVVQSSLETSPAKWHLAHTTWFFETFVLQPYHRDYRIFHPEFGYLFNSYYESVGGFHPRPERGLLTRPSLSSVLEYRDHVDRELRGLLAEPPAASRAEILERLELGMNHEQQHQELLLTDIKHLFSRNPLRPAYRVALPQANAVVRALEWLAFPAGIYEVGHAGDGFCFDNETPRHRCFLEAFRIASRPVTNGEFLEFMEAGGYMQPTLWLSDGWRTVKERGWSAPLYWERRDDLWWQFTLAGLRRIDPAEPVCHVSYYEADAFARWAGRRLPSEAEWEAAASRHPVAGNFADSGRLHPAPCVEPPQFFGDVWEWTRSAYGPYPGYRPTAGALGEYNGKFMVSQLVLRGASCATPRAHARATYRNFFYPADRWQFKGLRLACD
jgi:ergothioneine biosynthesis protein EgtB